MIRRKNMKKTMDMIVKEQWTDLLLFDELNRELAAGRILNGFIALQPSFPPTFKRVRNYAIQKNPNFSDKFGQSTGSGKERVREYVLRKATSSTKKKDGVISESDVGKRSLQAEEAQAVISPEELTVEDFYNDKRMPSFTDRILYKSMPAFTEMLTSLYFRSCEEALSSDHKPVYAGFELKLTNAEEDIKIDRSFFPRGNSLVKKAHNAPILQLEISNLRGEDLEEMDAQIFGGGSDPYIVITTDPGALLLYGKRKKFSQNGGEGIKSSVVKHDLNPVWKETMTIYLNSIDIQSLEHSASLIFSVWDEDLYNAHDLIGVFSIPLREVIRHGGKYDFSEDLKSRSEIMGKLHGTITITEDIEHVKERFKSITEDHLLSLRAAAMENAHGVQCCTLS